MDLHQRQTSDVRRSLKRKLELEFTDDPADQVGADRKVLVIESQEPCQDLLGEVASQVNVLNSSLSSSQSDRVAAKRAVHVLCELAKNGTCFSLFIFYILVFVLMPVSALLYMFFLMPGMIGHVSVIWLKDFCLVSLVCVILFVIAVSQ